MLSSHQLKSAEPSKGSLLALSPLFLFLGVFFGTGLALSASGVQMPFYQLRAPVAILPALALGLLLAQRAKVKPIETLLGGMGEVNVVLMCLIYLLAGAFSEVAKATGAVDAAVALGLGFVPDSFILPGVFVVSSFISLAIGTSMGTIAAVTPIALGAATAAGLDKVWVMGAVLSGATFGDNLSVISDTAIVASRTQGSTLREKFVENFKFALPAALLTIVVLYLHGGSSAAVVVEQKQSAWLIVPYVIALVLALAGLDVVYVLGLGIVLAGAFGMVLTPNYSLLKFTGDIYNGYESMVDITLLSLFIGGLGALMKATGGLDWLERSIARLGRNTRNSKVGQLTIVALTSATDAFTANNTVAVLICGPLARDVAKAHNVSPRRAASLIDIFACVVQGVIPYGAQILLAGSLASVSPLALARSVHYCWLLGGAAFLGIFLIRDKQAVIEPVADVTAAPTLLADQSSVLR